MPDPGIYAGGDRQMLFEGANRLNLYVLFARLKADFRYAPKGPKSRS